MNWSVLLAVPFYLAGKAWGLLVFKALLFVVGGWGVYRIAQLLLPEGKHLACWSLVHYYGMWGLWSAAFDFHEVAIATAAVPWAIYFYLRGNFGLAFWAWLIAMGSKELFAIWGLFLWTGWAYTFRRTDPLHYRKALLLSLFSLLYLLLIILLGVFWAEKRMGAVSRIWLYYAYLTQTDPFSSCSCQLERIWECLPSGYSFLSLFKLLLRPQRIWTFLLESPHPTYAGIKSELYWSFLLSGGWAIWWAPILAWMFLPIFLYKMLAANYFMWGTLHHYSLEFAILTPILVVWAFRENPLRRFILSLAALLAQIMQLSLLDSRVSKWYAPERHRWYARQHYESEYDYATIHEVLAQIPSKVPVSAVSCVIPHLPSREKLYHFPIIGEAQYIILLLGQNPCSYPLSPGDYFTRIDSLKQSGAWAVFHESPSLIILKKQ